MTIALRIVTTLLRVFWEGEGKIEPSRVLETFLCFDLRGSYTYTNFY